MADIAATFGFSFEAMCAWPLETLGKWHRRAVERMTAPVPHG